MAILRRPRGPIPKRPKITESDQEKRQRYSENARRRKQEKIKNGEWQLKRTPLRTVGKKQRQYNNGRKKSQRKSAVTACLHCGCSFEYYDSGLPAVIRHHLFGRALLPEMYNNPLNLVDAPVNDRCKLTRLDQMDDKERYKFIRDNFSAAWAEALKHPGRHHLYRLDGKNYTKKY